MANKSTISSSQIERLQEIKDEIKELMNEAKQIIRQGRPIIWERARGYCYGHIVSALDNDHEFMGREMFTLQNIIDELKSDLEPEEEGDAGVCPKCNVEKDPDGSCECES